MMDKKKKQPEFPLHSPRGMRDVLPEEAMLFEKLRSIVSGTAQFYGFGFIETPIVEHAALYEKGVGEATDIVSKEMYLFRTKGGDRLALRPEGTAGVARAYIEHGMHTLPQPVKLWYWGPMFRHDAPQALRYRQFRHAGFECFGEEHPVIDVEMIQLAYRALEKFGIPAMRIEISSLGCKECRKAYRGALKSFYRPKARKLCVDCRRRLAENPLRLFDCKEEFCSLLRQGAPEIVERLCDACRAHFKKVLGMLDDLGYPYFLNPFLARGLDYYNRTVFEIFSGALERLETPFKKLAISAGGRYDYLVENLGGPKTCAVGFAIGVERAVAALRQIDNKQDMLLRAPSVFLVQLGDLARVKALKLMEEFRKEEIGLAASLGRDSIKAQLKAADRIGASFALIIGQKEASDNSVILRDMLSGSQETIPAEQIIDTIKVRLKKRR